MSAARNMGGSVLPSSEPRILQPIPTKHGVLQVVAVPELDTHALRFKTDRGTLTLAMHANGYSCHILAERIARVWAGDADESTADEQFDYILACGGMGISPTAFMDILARS